MPTSHSKDTVCCPKKLKEENTQSRNLNEGMSLSASSAKRVTLFTLA